MQISSRVTFEEPASHTPIYQIVTLEVRISTMQTSAHEGGMLSFATLIYQEQVCGVLSSQGRTLPMRSYRKPF
jgi:hypothetical protein